MKAKLTYRTTRVGTVVGGALATKQFQFKAFATPEGQTLKPDCPTQLANLTAQVTEFCWYRGIHSWTELTFTED